MAATLLSPRDPAESTRRAHTWTTQDAARTYGVCDWGRDHFSINEVGHLTVSDARGKVDLKELVDHLKTRGVAPPLLLRFSDLLRARLEGLNDAFASAIRRYRYGAHYQGVYPIKVNQNRAVVAGVVGHGRRCRFGLEVGSKPELLAAMAMLDNAQSLLVCNGYKDAHYVETALLASKLGRRVMVVIEKPSELLLLKQAAEKLNIVPRIGVRMRLSSRGAGRWEKSVGARAKFGLSAPEILLAVERLKGWGMLDSLQLLHFHMGSQITAIGAIEAAMCEGARTYVELVKLGCRALRYFDVGGGLGVDHDGSQTRTDASLDYSVQAYADAVVAGMMAVCDNDGVAHPVLVSESGRALVAHHSVLIVEVVGVSRVADPRDVKAPADDAPDVMHQLWALQNNVTTDNVRARFRHAVDDHQQALSLFNRGELSLAQRGYCERAFWGACRRMLEVTGEMAHVPEELARLEDMLRDTYFCNFSIFQSLPDAWAIGQLFPMLPIHRLQERPDRRGALADITCDSDGKIDAFIGPRKHNSTLPLHHDNGEPYYLAVMLTGAYQEILGDRHNLFGDTHVVHVQFDDEGRYLVGDVFAGDTNTDVLRHVGYLPELLLRRVRTHVEVAVKHGSMTLDESRNLIEHYRQALDAYTYLA